MSLPNVNDPQVKKDIEENKVLAAIGYIWILFLLPLLLKPKSAFCKFHAKQALVIFIASLINSVIFMVPVLGWIIGFVGFVALVFLTILGILKALGGEYYEMPYVAEYAKKINI